MAQKKFIKNDKPIGKKSLEKKPLLDAKQKNRIWTIVILVILLIFFIINNTKDEPEQGPYPPNYSPAQINNNQ